MSALAGHGTLAHQSGIRSGLLDGLHFGREARLQSSGRVGVDDPLGAGSIETLDGQPELALGQLDIVGVNRLADFSTLGPHRLLGGPVPCSPDVVLLEPFFGTIGVGHGIRVSTAYRYLLGGIAWPDRSR